MSLVEPVLVITPPSEHFTSVSERAVVRSGRYVSLHPLQARHFTKPSYGSDALTYQLSSPEMTASTCTCELTGIKELNRSTLSWSVQVNTCSCIRMNPIQISAGLPSVFCEASVVPPSCGLCNEWRDSTSK